MGLLLNLYLGHLLGDFVFQPGWLVAAKRKGATGVLVHGAIIGICTAIILFADITNLLDVVLLSTAAHLAIELATIRLRTGENATGLSVFLIDQVLHLVTLVLLVRLVTPWADVETVRTFGFVVTPTLLALLCSLVIVSFMGSIVVLEATNTLGPQALREDILPYDMRRLYGMAERSVGLLLSVLVHPALMLAAFVPRVGRAWFLDTDARAGQMLAAAAGLVITALGWALVLLVAAAAEPGF